LLRAAGHTCLLIHGVIAGYGSQDICFERLPAPPAVPRQVLDLASAAPWPGLARCYGMGNSVIGPAASRRYP
jgi:hypothetical protein